MSTDQVGFELLTVKHLSLLRQEGVDIKLSQHVELQNLHNSGFPRRVFIKRLQLYPTLLKH